YWALLPLLCSQWGKGVEANLRSTSPELEARAQRLVRSVTSFERPHKESGCFRSSRNSTSRPSAPPADTICVALSLSAKCDNLFAILPPQLCGSNSRSPAPFGFPSTPSHLSS